ncbi:hypothetical protein L6164_024782 [Bauhinia variegata]|uniref:Uncharacterized protein n=1 Tax=Bauhinia variegata TaxID=167791 RepID=A0ACB9LYK2_BAUVA|nr:hypothetical protein L6164_024782 [Bauhinia variegata]
MKLRGDLVYQFCYGSTVYNFPIELIDAEIITMVEAKTLTTATVSARTGKGPRAELVIFDFKDSLASVTLISADH